jgi:hypothetical protein
MKIIKKLNNMFTIFNSTSSKTVIRTGDLAPTGIKYTIPVGGDFNTVFQHIFEFKQK